jgi:nucleoside phosphorylase
MPPVHFGPVLSGDKVVASKSALEQFTALSDSALGVEMEGAGVAFAAARAEPPVACLMVRGVVDHADDQKRVDAAKWSDAARGAAARFVVATLERWIERSREG